MKKNSISYKNLVKFSSLVVPQYARTMAELQETYFEIFDSTILCDFDNLLFGVLMEEESSKISSLEDWKTILPFYQGVEVTSYTNCDLYLVPGYTSNLFSKVVFKNCRFHSPTQEKTFIWKNKKCSLETIHNPSFHWIARYEDNSIAYLQEYDIVKLLATHPVYKHLVPKIKSGELNMERFCLGIDRESYGSTYDHSVEESTSFASNCTFDIVSVSTIPSNLLLHPKGLDSNWTNVIRTSSFDWAFVRANGIVFSDLASFSQRIELENSYASLFYEYQNDVMGQLLDNTTFILDFYGSQFLKKYSGVVVLNSVLFPVSTTIIETSRAFTTSSGQALTLTILNPDTAVSDGKLIVKIDVA